MRIHHFYPRTRNIGDHFVQRGIKRMIKTIVPDAAFDLFNVNSRGEDKTDYGLTRAAVERANREADLVIVGGSNLYEGSLRWRWGVHLEIDALKNLRVPLFLLGIGTGSDFLSRPHNPSLRARDEIRLLNEYATFSGVRDVMTYNWLRQLGVSKAQLTGDPAAFIFNRPVQRNNHDGHVLLTMPPVRFWAGKHRFWNVRVHGRAMFKGMISLTRALLEKNHRVLVTCNDPADLPLAGKLFDRLLPTPVICPQTPEEYFQILSASRAVLSGRLHTAVVSFSLGIPFALMDVDQRTNGFIKTYQIDDWSISPSRHGIESQLKEMTDRLLGEGGRKSWEIFIEKRDHMYERAMKLLRDALRAVI
jgi:polysaccharide pyruvyl transferase WcaK-like protein